MQGITPHLWFDRHAREAAELYVSTLPDSQITDVTTLHGTPSGDADIVSFVLCGQPFQAINGGPLFSFNPSVSFLVACRTAEEVDAHWAALSDGGSTLMELGAYPFSPRYGWTTDRYGLSWQVMQADPGPGATTITPTLMFVGDVCGRADEAVGYYTSTFPSSSVGDIARYEEMDGPNRPGTVKHAAFTLAGQPFAAMDSALGHDFGFNEAISFMVVCESQEEIDRYWDRLSAVAEAEQCGWLQDRYGLAWQVVPARLDEMLRNGTEEQLGRVTQAFLPMKKFDLATLERVYQGDTARTGTSG